jgi:uncharacterized membrane protein
MTSFLVATTLVSALGSGLVAGIFFAFSTFVMGALGRLPAEQGIAAMQSINVVVLNPLFLGVFLGTAALCLLIAVIAFFARQEPAAIYLFAGCALYLIGALLVTMAGNVPLNDALAGLDPASAVAADQWRDYLRTWTMWNHVRTVGALLAAAAFTLALRVPAASAG